MKKKRSKKVWNRRPTETTGLEKGKPKKNREKAVSIRIRDIDEYDAPPPPKGMRIGDVDDNENLPIKEKNATQTETARDWLNGMSTYLLDQIKGRSKKTKKKPKRFERYQKDK